MTLFEQAGIAFHRNQALGGPAELQEAYNKAMFEGVILCSFDQILGPTPSAIHPQGFIRDEQSKKLAEEAMLLLVAGTQDSFHTIMSFPDIGKLGVVGVYPSLQGNTLAIIAVFNEKAQSILWRGYPLIRSLLLTEVANAMRQTRDAAARLFSRISELCNCLSEQSNPRETASLVEKSIEKASMSIQSLVDSGQLRTQSINATNMKTSLSNLLIALRNMRRMLGNST
jgi:hypothetical protein